MRLRKSIFTKLIGCFILYAIIMVITFALCLLLDVLVMSKGNPAGIYPVGILDENGDVADLETIQNIGGWVEELDEDYHVIRVYGEKKNDTESYSADELLALTSAFGQTEHIGFFIQPEDRSSKYLCIYSRDVMHINFTLLLNNAEKNGGLNFYLLFFPMSILEIVLISLYLRKKIKKPLEQIIAGMEGLKASLSNTDQCNIPGSAHDMQTEESLKASLLADEASDMHTKESLKPYDGGARIQIKTEAEFEKIVDTFNLMARQLEEEKAKGELLTQKKNQMLLELSHDIRTPIATIKSYANALEEGLVPEEKMQNVYRIIDGKAGRVQKLSEDMFVMLKMDSADYKPCLETVDLCEFLRQLCAEYYDEITESGYVFDVSIPDAPIPVFLDTDLFARVAGNLLSNAQRYNRTGKEISVALRSECGKALLTVSDDGQEIDEAFAGQMFQAFSRGDQARKTDGGTGLGLAISRIIVEKHGGSIGYRRRDGKNVFAVELPSPLFGDSHLL